MQDIFIKSVVQGFSPAIDAALKDCATRPPPSASAEALRCRAGGGHAFFRCKQLYALGNKSNEKYTWKPKKHYGYQDFLLKKKAIIIFEQ